MLRPLLLSAALKLDIRAQLDSVLTFDTASPTSPREEGLDEDWNKERGRMVENEVGCDVKKGKELLVRSSGMRFNGGAHKARATASEPAGVQVSVACQIQSATVEGPRRSTSMELHISLRP